ncbi:rod shape-determining protein MreC [Peptoanaerobacter stomatis]|jgi:rod shape-determining protein mreC|uniref:Cell shape-determining protein MreC n=1 Tax=Peptoanaerobacter stomatis TaxID=796937 RepID=V9HSA9_9FIRM|nr:rod shape-determining protein MreC [Peptoanaerobacter stomatis]EHL18344.1 rod shape-determining protein MreC [Peptoanaerobacter stomatis]
MFNVFIKGLVKWKKVIAAVTVFLVLAVMLINSIRYEKTSSINNKGFDVFTQMSLIGNKIRNKFISDSTDSELEKLKEENRSLRDQLIKNTMQEEEVQELNNLKNALKFVTDKTASDFISADIVARNDGNYYNSFTISAGSDNGVKSDSIVVNGDGLIGRVYQVSQKYSKAVSIIDSRFPVSFQIIGRSSDTGMLSQDVSITQIEDASLIKGYMFDVNSPVKIDDIVTTSGLGLYPAGIPIGKVQQIIPDEQNILKYIVVQPYVNFKKLDKVMVFNKKDL